MELKESESFKVDGSKEKTLCLVEQGKEVVTFDLTFLDLGEVNITIVARIDPSYPDACGPDVVLAVRSAQFLSSLLRDYLTNLLKYFNGGMNAPYCV